jgi:hypothetical protein
MPRWTCLLAGLALLFSACGSGDKLAKTPPPAKQSPTTAPPPVPVHKPAARADVAVIRGWTDALRHGHVDAATDYFSLPAVISNGGPAYKLTKRKQVRFFKPHAAVRRDVQGGDRHRRLRRRHARADRAPGPRQVRHGRRQRGVHRVPHPPPQDRAVAAGAEAGARDDSDSGRRRELAEEAVGDLDALGHPAGRDRAVAPVDVAQPVGAGVADREALREAALLADLRLAELVELLPFFLPLAR